MLQTQPSRQLRVFQNVRPFSDYTLLRTALISLHTKPPHAVKGLQAFRAKGSHLSRLALARRRRGCPSSTSRLRLLARWASPSLLLRRAPAAWFRSMMTSAGTPPAWVLALLVEGSPATDGGSSSAVTKAAASMVAVARAWMACNHGREERGSHGLGRALLGGDPAAALTRGAHLQRVAAASGGQEVQHGVSLRHKGAQLGFGQLQGGAQVELRRVGRETGRSQCSEGRVSVPRPGWAEQDACFERRLLVIQCRCHSAPLACLPATPLHAARQRS